MKKKIVATCLLLALLITMPTGNIIVQNFAERNYVQYQTKIENYNPPVLKMTENSGISTKLWSENQYTYEKVENFLDNRKVVDHYEEQPKYGVWAADSFISRVQVKSDLSELDEETLTYLESEKDENWWLNYFESVPYGRPRNFSVEPNKKQSFEYGFQNFQGFINWRKTKINVRVGTNYYVPIPETYRYLREEGKYQVPIYKEENYTRWRTKTFENTDYEAEGWKKTKVEVKLSEYTPSSYIKNNIRLNPKTKRKGLKVSLENNILTSRSSVVKLDIQPTKKMRKGKYPIFLEAYNSENEKIDTSKYKLTLKKGTVPENKHKKINEEVSDKKPNEEGETKDGRQKNWVGVGGSVYSSETGERLIEYSDGVKVYVERDGSSANATWPTSTQYAYRNYTYLDLTWEMKIRATAKNHYPSTAIVEDSTDDSGWTEKNFKLKSQ